MQNTNLFIVCGAAFLMVFVLLAALALIMRLVTLFFPQQKAGTDAAVLAAVSAAVQNAFPGSKIRKIEERE